MKKRLLAPIIQGGMGIGVSNWELAQAVAIEGQLGVVSGTALENLMIRRLQSGDQNTVNALKAFPFPRISQAIISKYYIEGGKADTEKFKTAPLASIPLSHELSELIMAANFSEVWLAKEKGGLVGIN